MKETEKLRKTTLFISENQFLVAAGVVLIRKIKERYGEVSVGQELVSEFLREVGILEQMKIRTESAALLSILFRQSLDTSEKKGGTIRAIRRRARNTTSKKIEKLTEELDLDFSFLRTIMYSNVERGGEIS